MTTNDIFGEPRKAPLWQVIMGKAVYGGLVAGMVLWARSSEPETQQVIGLGLVILVWPLMPFLLFDWESSPLAPLRMLGLLLGMGIIKVVIALPFIAGILVGLWAGWNPGISAVVIGWGLAIGGSVAWNQVSKRRRNDG